MTERQRKPVTDPEADTGQLPAPVAPTAAQPSLCGPTGRPHRFIASKRHDKPVCADCGAYDPV